MTEMNSDTSCSRSSIQIEQSTVKGSIESEIYTSFDALPVMQPEWDNFIKAVGGEIFLTYDWCRTWWKYYGPKRELAIFIFRNSSKICGIVPLFREKIWIGPISIAVIKMVGSDFIPATFTIPIEQSCINQVVSLLIDEINARWQWHLLHLGTICGKYDSLGILANSFKSKLGHKYECEVKSSGVQTYFTVADNWEAQVASLASKQRTNVRRTFRDISNKGIEITSHLASKDTLSRMFENFVQLHQKHWQGIGQAGHFEAWPFSKEFHGETAETQLKHNRLRLLEIKFNNMSAGYEYLYRFNNTYCWFLNARNDFEDYARIDHKWIAFRAKIEYALNDNVKVIDGMRGMYDYKLLMGGKVESINNLFIYPKRFPALQRVLAFRLLARGLNILYYKIWRARVAPRFRIKLKTFWEKWVRFHPLSF